MRDARGVRLSLDTFLSSESIACVGLSLSEPASLAVDVFSHVSLIFSHVVPASPTGGVSQGKA